MGVWWHALAFVTHERAKMSHKPGRNLTQAGPKCHTRAKMSHSHVIILLHAINLNNCNKSYFLFDDEYISCLMMLMRRYTYILTKIVIELVRLITTQISPYIAKRYTREMVAYQTHYLQSIPNMILLTPLNHFPHVFNTCEQCCIMLIIILPKTVYILPMAHIIDWAVSMHINLVNPVSIVKS